MARPYARFSSSQVKRVLAYNPGVHQVRPLITRPAADRCPGVLRLIEAADGLLARVRLPGGLVSAAQLRVLAALADGLGDGRAELTSHGNVQLRALGPGDAQPLSDELFAAGLLPSLSHDRVRNILASPLAGLDGGADLTGVVRALDAGLCARPRLAGLSGRFLFALDDGRGDVAGPAADVARADVAATVRPDGAVVNGLAVTASGPGATASGNAGDRVTAELAETVAAAMLAHAEAFLDLRAERGDAAWRISDLPDGEQRVRAAVAARLGLHPAQPAGLAPPAMLNSPAGVPADRPVGLVGRRGNGTDGQRPAPVRADQRASAVLLAPLGRLTAAQLTWLADRLGERTARVTPWRSVVLPHPPDGPGLLRDAAGAGFGTDDASVYRRVTACAGRPGCASALADVQADAAALAARWPDRLVHVSGCARHCGRPAATDIDITATNEGYQVAGV
jgi:precorrin-3B synthase